MLASLHLAKVSFAVYANIHIVSGISALFSECCSQLLSFLLVVYVLVFAGLFISVVLLQ